MATRPKPKTFWRRDPRRPLKQLRLTTGDSTLDRLVGYVALHPCDPVAMLVLLDRMEEIEHPRAEGARRYQPEVQATAQRLWARAEAYVLICPSGVHVRKMRYVPGGITYGLIDAHIHQESSRLLLDPDLLDAARSARAQGVLGLICAEAVRVRENLRAGAAKG